MSLKNNASKNLRFLVTITDNTHIQNLQQNRMIYLVNKNLKSVKLKYYYFLRFVVPCY